MQGSANERQLKSFGLSVGGVFLLIAMWPWLRRGADPRLWALLLGSPLFVLGLVLPKLLIRPHQLWMNLAAVLGWINTKIILGLIFYTVFSPTALILRLLGKDPMNRSFISNCDTYRVVREARPASHMKQQF